MRMSDNYSRLDFVIVILIGLAIVAWLITYAVLLILYGHDRTAKQRDGFPVEITWSLRSMGRSTSGSSERNPRVALAWPALIVIAMSPYAASRDEAREVASPPKLPLRQRPRAGTCWRTRIPA